MHDMQENVCQIKLQLPAFTVPFGANVKPEIFFDLASDYTEKKRNYEAEQHLQSSLSACLVQLQDMHDMQENVCQIKLQLPAFTVPFGANVKPEIFFDLASD